MKKRIFFSLALAAVIGGGVFAQNHFISAEISFLGGGARYEYVITPYLSISGSVYYNFLPTPFIDASYSESHSIFGIGIAGRWYPAGRRFFTELGLGYISFTNNSTKDYYSYSYGYGYSYSYNTDTDTHTFPGFSITPGFGWTIDVGRPGGFFVSPGIKIPISITSEDIFPLSLVVFLGLGYAF